MTNDIHFLYFILMNGAITKTRRAKPQLYKVKRDITAWEAIRGIWKKKRIADPVAWQKKIRKEWERGLI